MISGSVTLQERAGRVRAEVHRRVLERPVEAADARLAP